MINIINNTNSNLFNNNQSEYFILNIFLDNEEIPFVKILNSSWNESEHPRDKFGQFTDKKGSAEKFSKGKTGADTVNKEIYPIQIEKVTGYEKSDPVNAVYFKKPPFEITSDRKETIDNFKSWYKENLQGKSVNNPLLGKVYFYGSGMRESLHWHIDTLEKLKYISTIPEIIKSSKDITREKLKHPKPRVNCAYRVKGFIYDNGNKKISIVILEDDKGNRFYTFDAR